MCMYFAILRICDYTHDTYSVQTIYTRHNTNIQVIHTLHSTILLTTHYMFKLGTIHNTPHANCYMLLATQSLATQTFNT